jgi:hypothetical protein
MSTNNNPANEELLPEEQFFRHAAAQFSIVGPQISEAEIDAVFPEAFPGKADLVRFYLRHNGGSRTPQGCVIHCGNPAHRISRSHLEGLNLEGFRSIPRAADDRMLPFANMLRHHATMENIYSQIQPMKSFLEEHMEIAFDHSGNDLCLSRRSGRIFFMDWEAYSEGAVEVAASFHEFVLKFWNIPHAPVD